VHQHKARAVDQILRAEAKRHTFGEVRLPGPKLAQQHNRVACVEQLAEPLPDPRCLGRAVADTVECVDRLGRPGALFAHAPIVAYREQRTENREQKQGFRRAKEQKNKEQKNKEQSIHCLSTMLHSLSAAYPQPIALSADLLSTAICLSAPASAYPLT